MCKHDCRAAHMRCGKKEHSNNSLPLKVLEQRVEDAKASYAETPTRWRYHNMRIAEHELSSARRTNEGYDFRGIELVA